MLPLRDGKIILFELLRTSEYVPATGPGSESPYAGPGSSVEKLRASRRF